MSEITYKAKARKGLRQTILFAWLIVGTLDMSAAVIQTLISSGDPLKMLQFIASGVFGMNAFTSVMPYALLGALFHYILALGWTVLFFFIYPKIEFLSKNIFVTGILYGLFVWVIMNRVVLPISNTPPLTFAVSKAIIAAAVLIVAIGIPLAIIGRRYYSS